MGVEFASGKKRIPRCRCNFKPAKHAWPGGGFTKSCQYGAQGTEVYRCRLFHLTELWCERYEENSFYEMNRKHWHMPVHKRYLL